MYSRKWFSYRERQKGFGFLVALSMVIVILGYKYWSLSSQQDIEKHEMVLTITKKDLEIADLMASKNQLQQKNGELEEEKAQCLKLRSHCEVESGNSQTQLNKCRENYEEALKMLQAAGVDVSRYIDAWISLIESFNPKADFEKLLKVKESLKKPVINIFQKEPARDPKGPEQVTIDREEEEDDKDDKEDDKEDQEDDKEDKEDEILDKGKQPAQIETLDKSVNKIRRR